MLSRKRRAPSGTTSMMEAVEATKIYQQGQRRVQALAGVSLRVEAGEFVAIMGPSGSGKSTLMHLLGGLDTPTSGQVFFQGQDLHKMSDRERSLLRRNRVGFVFQAFNLLATLTAVENVALPLMLGGQSRREARERSLALLDRFGLSARADHFPDELSGGEMQRVAVARALVTEPEAVLCDEPTGNLDSASSQEILSLLRELPEQGRRAVVMVTHDPQPGGDGDRIVHLRDGLIESQRSEVRDQRSEEDRPARRATEGFFSDL